MGRAKKFIVGVGLIGLIYFLSQVFSGDLILPQTISLGFVSARYYGVIMALAAACGLYLAKKRAGKFGLEQKYVDDLLFWIVIGGFFGARIYHIFSSYSYYYSNSLEILKVWHGGLSIYGAVFGGFIAILFLSARYSLRITHLLNWLTPPLMLGQVLGRFGNLFNYELLGYPTELPWKMYVPDFFRPWEYAEKVFFHPWFLYEQVWLLLVLFFLLNREKKNPQKMGKGELFISYVLLYNIGRFFLEFLRVDSVFVFTFYRQNVLVSLGLVLVAGFFLLQTKSSASNQSGS